MIFLIPAILLVLYINTYCQQDSVWQGETADNEMELISEDIEDQSAEYLEETKDIRVNINTASIQQLTAVPGMLLDDAHKIGAYRVKAGRLFSLFELYAIEGINAGRLRTYFPYLIVDDIEKPAVGNNFPSFLNAELRTRMQTDIQRALGFSEHIYKGSPLKIYSRLRIKDKNYCFGFLADKDAGERDLGDYTSFHLQVRNIGIIKNFVAGDYNIEFGKGLALWSSYGLIRNPVITSGFRHARNLVPSLSSDETHYLRGAAANIEYRSIGITAFYSARHIDAGINPATNTVISLPADGYHRTETELSKKESLEQIVTGTRVDFHTDSFSAGVLFYTMRYDLALDTEKFPGGKRFNYLAFSLSWSVDRIFAEAEAARFHESTSWIASLRFDISEQIKAFVVTGNSPQDFFSPLGAVNKSGTCAGLSFNSVPGNLIFSFDSYKKYLTSAPFPVNCSDLITDYSVAPAKDILLRLRHKYKSEHSPAAVKNSILQSNRFTGEVTFKISRSIKWKWRTDLSFFSETQEKSSEKGYAFFQEATYHLFDKTLEVYGRITLFKTGSYDTRIYQYERSPAGVFIMNPLTDEGTYWYLGANIRFSKGLSLHCRFNEIYKPSEQSIGSGYNEINGSVHNQLLFQLDFRM